ncbi:MAG: SprB repeat-containing protein, partial [Bacteroidota bacterium]
MKRRLHFLYTTFIALFLIVLSFSFSSNPPNGRTGAPGDGLCTSCHNNSNPNGYNGTIDILNFPSTITPNQTYTLQAQVSVTAGTPSRAGFQAVALNASNNNAGSFSTTDPNVAVTPSGGREYVEHDPAISFGGGSSVVFNFDWTAPNAANGEVITVYTAGLLGNGSGSSNDYTITNTVSGTVSGGGGGGNPPTLSISSTDVSCFNGNNGTATIIASGGTPGYNYSWSNGGNGTSIFNLTAGNYTVTVTDNGGQTATASTLVNQPNPLVPFIVNQTNVDCFGNTTGAATVSSSGGTGNVAFSWSNGTNASTITMVPAGTYTVTATDFNNCTSTTSVTITQPNNINLTATGTNVSCSGANDGSASALGNGGTGGLTYFWSNGASGQTIFNLSAGTYTVTATDNSNCTRTATTTITAPNAIILNLTSTNIDCVGNNNGIASANASGGNGNFSYTWSNGGNGQTISNLPADTYTVTATDANNCTQTESVTITAPNAITLNLTSTNIDCVGNNNGIASANASGGNGNFSYTWSNGENGQTISNLPAGTYTVTATDANNCTQTESVTITAPNAITLNLTSTNIDCVGNNNGIASANASGGNGNFSYTWSNGGNGQTISNLPAGTYTVTATDANNCTQTESVVITAPNAIILNLTSTNIDCVGNNNGIASANASGGNGNFSYTWSNGGNGQTISNLAADTYTVTATDANNCTQTESVTITAPNAIILNLTSTNIDCVGNNNGIASANA